jgi:hypothetical protein
MGHEEVSVGVALKKGRSGLQGRWAAARCRCAAAACTSQRLERSSRLDAASQPV